ncbi:cleavage stimulation factor subunit 3-like isoform X1 [Styela clava]|uniref:cleavage stimulation factor subunit 3-like isoform X1 n=2 Tax=Styela clava TaxID=7725 RepID=UPI00193A9BE9|nr:cleavage stimulation factor subunit 3-like isoform X1 [Styela clava]
MATKSQSEEVEYVPERIRKIEKKLETSPYDVESWNSLIREAQTNSINKARRTYERLVSQFPSAGRYWKIYIEHEMKSRNYEKVEKLFQRCLMRVLNIDLWKCYISYVKETKSGLSSYREKMSQAYDFAIDKIGMDIMSFQLWADYVGFLKSVEAVGSYAENQRITAVRRVYQRGCINPMLNIEQLWREYNAYEQSINPIIAKKMVDDRTREYINARRVSKELEAMTRGLQRNNPATPPNPANPEEMKQVALWKKYIEWEKENPMRTEDLNLLTKRVMFAYEQCLLCLGQHPDVWYEASQYLVSTSKKMSEKGDTNSSKILADEAASMYERATSNLMKDNMLIHFAYSDFEEGRMKFEKVHSIYEKLLESMDIDQTLTYIQYMKFARRSEGIKAARQVFKKAREDTRVRFHVYVAAALMEYYCTKEKQIAFKIFELGLKRFGDEPDYLLSYIDYMSHLNEDNNTRVLFERVLTSGSLPPDKSGKIWDEYLEFECNVGDLSSMLKVEKRRLEAFKKEYDGKTTCLLVDRYRFLDLFPCTPEELKSIGYKDSRARPVVGVPAAVPSISEASTSQLKEENEPQIGVGLPMPDLTQMLPYRPRVNPLPGLHPVPGGEFPEPAAATALLRLMPPPKCFNGPFPIIDDLLSKFREWTLPEEKEWLKHINLTPGEFDPHRQLNVSKGTKRPSSNNNDDSDDESRTTTGSGGPGAPPVKDIYRARQQKRVR